MRGGGAETLLSQTYPSTWEFSCQNGEFPVLYGLIL